MKSGTRSKSAFARRLCALMTARGLTSDTSRSGIDVNALAAAADTSYEMARRYAEGIASPRAEKLAAIAQWLGVSPGALLWGDEEHRADVDTGILQACMQAIAEAQARTGVIVSTEKAAQIVALLYQETVAGRKPSPQTVDLIIRAA